MIFLFVCFNYRRNCISTRASIICMIFYRIPEQEFTQLIPSLAWDDTILFLPVSVAKGFLGDLCSRQHAWFPPSPTCATSSFLISFSNFKFSILVLTLSTTSWVAVGPHKEFGYYSVGLWAAESKSGQCPGRDLSQGRKEKPRWHPCSNAYRIWWPISILTCWFAWLILCRQLQEGKRQRPWVSGTMTFML